MAGVLFFTMVGSKIREVIDYQSCQRVYVSMGPLLLLVSILLLSPLVAILPWSVLWQKCFSDPCTGGTVVAGSGR